MMSEKGSLRLKRGDAIGSPPPTLTLPPSNSGLGILI